MAIDWSELFDLQKEFELRIMREKNLAGTKTIPWRVSALLVEVAEFANEGRWFKKWSNDQEPRRHVPLLDHWQRFVRYTDPLLEEFVDALHFMIGIGLELGFNTFESFESWWTGDGDLNECFQGINTAVTSLSSAHGQGRILDAWSYWKAAFALLMSIGEMVGLTQDEIDAAFKAKHIENHARQDRGY